MPNATIAQRLVTLQNFAEQMQKQKMSTTTIKIEKMASLSVMKTTQLTKHQEASFK